MLRGLEHLFCGDRLRDLECFSLERALGTAYSPFQYLEGLQESWRWDF